MTQVGSDLACWFCNPENPTLRTKTTLCDRCDTLLLGFLYWLRNPSNNAVLDHNDSVSVSSGPTTDLHSLDSRDDPEEQS